MTEQVIVWIAGTNWDSVAGTDKRLVGAMPRAHQILWVDPPVPARDPQAFGQVVRTSKRPPERVSENVQRVRVPVLPGVTRPGIRWITAQLLERTVISALQIIGGEPMAVVVAFPLARFPRGLPGRRILYVTDDWIDGSALMGFSRAAVQNVLSANLARAHGIAAVSEPIVNQLSHMAGSGPASAFSDAPGYVTRVIPNGGPKPVDQTPNARLPVAGLVGQLNERLDLDALEAVRNTGIHIEVIGPRAERDPAFRRRLDTFLSSGNVTWLGRLSAEEVASRMATFGVGLTPYVDSPFNRASFPLKTLEYLSAGVAVVSTDMPAARWLNTPHVVVGSTPLQFARSVGQALAQRDDPRASLARWEFAKGHTWDTRARDFIELLHETGRRQASLKTRKEY